MEMSEFQAIVREEGLLEYRAIPLLQDGRWFFARKTKDGGVKVIKEVPNDSVLLDALLTEFRQLKAEDAR